MITDKIIIGIVVSLIITYLLIYLSKLPYNNQSVESVFTGRDSLSPEMFYEKYFKDQGIPLNIVVKVREILEEQLGIDFSRLSDEDDFSENLKAVWALDSLADVEIILAFEEEFKIKISDEEANEMRTVRDMIKTIWAKTKTSINIEKK